MSSSLIVWSRATRLVHWAIAIVVTLNLFVLEDGDPPHRYIGYAAVALVVCRFVYGFLTTTESAFKKWPLSIRELRKFISAKRRFGNVEYAGHNPAASWVYILIWLCIIFLGVTGFMMGLDYFWGDENLQNIHELFSIALQVLIIVHFLGIALDSVQYKRKTWLGMFTGKK